MAIYRVVPERSQLWAEARSSLHPVRVETTGFEGQVEADLDGGEVRLGTATGVELDARRLRSGNALLDFELERRIEVRRFPKVGGEVKGVRAGDGPGRFLLHGELSFHGVTRPISAPVTLRRLDESTIEVEGEQVIDMRDFGLTPPKLLFLSVQPEVRVRVRLVARRD